MDTRLVDQLLAMNAKRKACITEAETKKADQNKVGEEIASLEAQLATIREEMNELKVKLYARFGRSINLD